jgi:dihydroorotate dehydrogenase
LKRVKEFREEATKAHEVGKILGINIGKNKDSTDAVQDYLEGLRVFADYADYIVINVSSPNTPGLRTLQNKKELENLIDPVRFILNCPLNI